MLLAAGFGVDFYWGRYSLDAKNVLSLSNTKSFAGITKMRPNQRKETEDI